MRKPFYHLEMGDYDVRPVRLLLFVAICVLSLFVVTKAHAQTNDNHLMVGVGALYEKGLDATIAYEHGTKYHNACLMRPLRMNMGPSTIMPGSISQRVMYSMMMILMRVM